MEPQINNEPVSAWNVTLNDETPFYSGARRWVQTQAEGEMKSSSTSTNETGYRPVQAEEVWDPRRRVGHGTCRLKHCIALRCTSAPARTSFQTILRQWCRPRRKRVMRLLGRPRFGPRRLQWDWRVHQLALTPVGCREERPMGFMIDAIEDPLSSVSTSVLDKSSTLDYISSDSQLPSCSTLLN